MAFLQVSNITKSIHGERVLENISFTQEPFQKIVIAGQTGSGKSTLLKIIAGLEQPDNGDVLFLDKKVKGPAETLVPGHPQIAYLSQHFELPQFLRVEQVLEYANQIDSEHADRLFRICAIDHLARRRTDELSGGERQRIALAKLLIGAPRLLLLDEPFTNLDMVQKNNLRQVLAQLAEHFKISIILVSHDPMDILPWASAIHVMKDGRIVQSGNPVDVYELPKSEYVAGLLGNYNILSNNFLKNIFDVGVVRSAGIIRPDFVRVHAPKEDGMSAKILSVQFFGSYYEVTAHCRKQRVVARVNANSRVPAVGSTVGLSFNKTKISLINQHTQTT